MKKLFYTLTIFGFIFALFGLNARADSIYNYLPQQVYVTYTPPVEYNWANQGATSQKQRIYCPSSSSSICIVKENGIYKAYCSEYITTLGSNNTINMSLLCGSNQHGNLSTSYPPNVGPNSGYVVILSQQNQIQEIQY